MIKLVYRLLGTNGAHSNTLPVTSESARSLCYPEPLSTGGHTLYQIPYLQDILAPSDEFIATTAKYLRTGEPFIYELPWNVGEYFDNIFAEVPGQVVQGVKFEGGYFLVNDAVDPVQRHRIEQFVAALDRNHIPRNKVIWLTGDIDTEKFNNIYGIHVVVSDWNEIVVSGTVLHNPEFEINDPEDKPKHNKFISLNRMWHQHRMLLLYNVVRRNLLSHFDISFLKTEPCTNKTFRESFMYFAEERLSPEQLSTLDQDILRIEQLLPLVVDIDASGGGSHAYNVIHSQYYFNVVPETTFFNLGGEYLCTHASEKIFKPIMYKSPFILFGPAGTLQALRKRGYQTFGSYIDESYDLEQDDITRFNKVMDLIESISRMNSSELDSLYAKLYPICLHNYQVLKQRNSIALNQLVNNLKSIVCSGKQIVENI